MKVIKIIGYVLGSVLAIFILTNPSPRRFKEYIGDLDLKGYANVCRRTTNGIVFSIYERQVIQPDGYRQEKERFVGVFLNFKRIN